MMWRSFCVLLDRLAAVRSARNSTLLITGITLVTKPIGYVRTILVAWLFGASASMDAYNMVLGLVGFFVGSMSGALENAVLPTLISALHKEPERGRDLMGCINLMVVAFGCLVCLLLAIWGRTVVVFFAPGFTGERLAWSVVMIWCLLPYTFSLAIKTGFDAWMTATERYVLPSVISAITSFLGFIVFVAGAFFWGEVSLPISMSFWLVCNAICLFFSVQDMPLCFHAFPAKLLKKVFSDFVPSLGILGVGAIFTLVDRYFISMLSVGGVTQLTYANLYFCIIISFATSPMLIFLTKSVKIAESELNDNEKNNLLIFSCSQAIEIAFTYFVPISVSCAATAIPVIRIVWGYGAFSPEAVRITGLCVAAYFIAGPLTLTCNVFYRIAQTRKKLYGVTLLSAVSMGINGLLDWLFYLPFGAPGVALATSITWFVVSLMYSKWLIGNFSMGMSTQRNIILQIGIASIWGSGVFLISNTTSNLLGIFGIILCGVCVIIHFIIIEYFGLCRGLPTEWKPSAFFKFVSLKL